MIEDLTSEIGIPLQFDSKTLEVRFGPGITILKEWSKTLEANAMSGDYLWKSLRFAKDCTDEEGNIIKNPNLPKFWKNDSPLYFGYQRN